MTKHAGNPVFRELFHSSVHNARFYAPADGESGYHISRVVGAQSIDLYAQSGATREVLEAITKALETLFEDESSKAKIRTDGTLLVQNLRYRLKYPVDEDCMIRLGAVLTFMESDTYGTEAHDSLNPRTTEQKVGMAKSDPDLYAFFLTLGATNMPAYKDFSDICLDPQYLNQRREVLRSLTPLHLFPSA